MAGFAAGAVSIGGGFKFGFSKHINTPTIIIRLLATVLFTGESFEGSVPKSS